MKKRFVCFLLALTLAAAMLPVSALADGGVTDRILTSYDPDNYVELIISGNTLTVSGKLKIEGLEDLWLRCGAAESTIAAESGDYFSQSIPLDLTEAAVVKEYYATGDSLPMYSSYIWNTVYIEPTGGGYRFMKSLVLDNNMALGKAYADPDKYRDASLVAEKVKAMSNEIVGGETDEYRKIFLLHKWVAENIYYDYDSYYSGDRTFYDAEGVLASKRSVCEGYAELLKNLIQAQGIPAMKTTTYALGLGSNGASFATSADHAAVTTSNHAHVEAYVNGRWVIMDPTWDSNNKYQNGVYDTQPVKDFYYFDITPEALALNHKYITRGDRSIRILDGNIVGADPLPVLNAAPTGSTVLVNGAEVKFDAYTINGNNYFKLRDLAYVLSGSAKQFNVTWNDAKGEIELVSQSAYTPVGGELQQGGGKECQAALNVSTIYLDGCVEPLTAYTINGNNYFKLRDLGIAFDFDVTWDGERNTVIIDTASSYTPD